MHTSNIDHILLHVRLYNRLPSVARCVQKLSSDTLRLLPLVLCLNRRCAGPWPEDVVQMLPAGYVALSEACWARQRTKRPSAQEVLKQLLHMLAEAEGRQT